MEIMKPSTYIYIVIAAFILQLLIVDREGLYYMFTGTVVMFLVIWVSYALGISALQSYIKKERDAILEKEGVPPKVAGYIVSDIEGEVNVKSIPIAIAQFILQVVIPTHKEAIKKIFNLDDNLKELPEKK